MAKPVRKKSFKKKIFGLPMSLFILIIIALISILAFTLLNKQILSLFSHGQTTYPCQFASSPGATPAFCDSFDQPMGIGDRGGDLNGVVWGASRVTGNNSIPSILNEWPVSDMKACGTTTKVQPYSDIVICNGQLNESQDDNGLVSSLTMYPKQPFDFANRTGTVVFDVSDNSQGNHGAWPEFWITDKPVPAPFVHEGNWHNPQNGFGIRLDSFLPTGQANGRCGNDFWSGGNPAPVSGVPEAVIMRNYIEDDSFSGGTLQVIPDECILEPTQPGQVNHIEVRVSQNQIDVFGTDAFSGVLDLTKTPLKHLATVPNANLTFTRGLIWLEDAHYNANKFGTQGTNTFTWDNVGFDGPVLARDAAYDADQPPALTGYTDVNNGYSTFNTGSYVFSGQNGTAPLNLPVPGITQQSINNATGALLTYNLYFQSPPPSTLFYTINGHQHSFAWPFPADDSAPTVAAPIPVSEIQAGTNTVTFTTDSTTPMEVSNVDIILVAGGGIPTCIDPSNCSGTTVSPTPTMTPMPSTTPVPTPTASNSVNIGNFAFAPQSLTVPAGTTVTWSNVASSTSHTVTSDTALFDSGSISPGTAYQHTFTTPGTYTYHCSFHPTMTGTIIVTAGSTPTVTPTTFKIGDINNDGSVDLLDVSIMLSHWNASYAPADLNHDGVVSLVDLSILLSHWGT